MSVSQTTVLKLYEAVIEDTINGSREFFAEEGIDDQILLELRASWESKVKASKAIDPPVQPEVTQLPKTAPQPQSVVNKQNKGGQYTPTIVNNSVQQLKMIQQQKMQQQLQQQQQHQHQHQQHQHQHIQHHQQPQQQNNLILPSDYANKYVPIQITLPAQPGSQESGSRVLSIQVPSSAIQGNILQSILTGPVITNSMALPTHLATALLQQHVNNVLQGQSISGIQTVQSTEVIQQQQQQLQQNNQTFISGNGSTGGVKRTIAQVDGTNDSSTSDEDDDDIDDDLGDDDDDDDDEDDDKEDQNSASDAEPLNSGDDVSDVDNGDLFETDNVIVCQYDKITRSRNKWKLYFKDGIMSLNGYDYVFQKATGDAEW
ncbi:transcription initiation factor IIA subunit 1 [Daktulosphaira vitifoliae]|uniref:transcription initiation factor IIA subunit 1 n=1 Tax=Daktulosphaira vitifoliae TaxID=58002 RepID=UPI0021A9A5C4|nr:transcription initiation factor IIA subunit 1 [Daktulosphaira vitifoliae]